jgi:Ca2+-binding RTX toxin-like protein
LELERLEFRAMVSHAIGEHIHPILRIVIEGQEVTIPADIGLTPTRHYSPHTHDEIGVLHVGEGPLAGIDPPGSPSRLNTLEDFFDVWRTTGPAPAGIDQNDIRFSSTRIFDHFADATHRITMTVNGVPNSEFENYSPHGTPDPDDPNNEIVVISFEQIAAANQRPTANAQSVAVLPNGMRSITLTGDDGDPSVVQGLSFRVQTLPASGTLLDSNNAAVTVGATLPSANVTYTPNPGFSGNDSFTFIVMDDGGMANGGQDTSTPATVSITVAPNQRPTANAQTVNAVQDAEKAITLSGNDGDAGLTQQLAFRVQSLPANGTLSDSIGNPVVVGRTVHGSSASGASVTYTPNPGFTGSDSFTFDVQDNGGTEGGGQDTSPLATVSLNVAPRVTPPVGMPGGTVKLNDGRLMVRGGPENNVFDIALSADGERVEVDTGTGTPQTFALSSLDRLCIQGRRGADTITIDPDVEVPAHIRGGRGPDEIVGGSGPDRIRGGRGPDTIDGGAGDDILRGRRGADLVMGGDGDDWMRGGRGPDSMDGGAGSDTMHGGRGTNTDLNPDPADRVFDMA